MSHWVRRYALWLLALLPLGLGVLLSIGLQRTLDIPPSFYVRAEISALVWLLGLFVTLGLLAFLGVRLWLHRRMKGLVARSQERCSEERRRFLRRLDHELKNPLTAIQAALANVAYATTSDARTKSLTSVKNQVLRIGRLVSDLRKLAELETRVLEFAPLDLTELLQELIVVAQDWPDAAQRRITLSVPQAWPLPKISGDWDLIFLAVYNLLSNAVKFTHLGDTVEVRAFEDGKNVVVEVADTGPGIALTEQPLVWEELYRAPATRAIPGSGLGLALVRAIIERHRGHVTLRSRPGQGSVFTLHLPFVKRSTQRLTPG